MRTLSPAELELFNTEGFVVIPDFFSATEVVALQAEVAELKANGKLRNVVVAQDGTASTTSTTAFNLQICPIGLVNSRLIASLPWRAGVPEVVATLLGGDSVQHLDQIFLKPGKHGVGTKWHADNAYFQATDPRFGVGMWIAVHAANRANGSMRLIPRSHLQTFAHERDSDSDHHITCAKEIDERHEILVEVPAGGVVFFNYGVAHATGPNTTDRERAGLALHFMLGSNVSTEDHAFKGIPVERWRWLSGARCTGGLEHHGEDLRGQWVSEVERLSRSGNRQAVAI